MIDLEFENLPGTDNEKVRLANLTSKGFEFLKHNYPELHLGDLVCMPIGMGKDIAEEAAKHNLLVSIDGDTRW